MNQTHDFEAAVLIGRFQPFHNGHAVLLDKALSIAPRVLVILGSSFHARSPKNPFTWQERAAMIESTLSEEDRTRVTFIPIRDYYDDVRWGKAVGKAIREAGVSGDRIALVGHVKDASSYYLNRFPFWKFINVSQQGDIDATHLRQLYFESEHRDATSALLAPLVPPAVRHYLKGWTALPSYAQLQADHVAVVEYKKRWGNGPFLTADALVRASKKVLLIKRGKAPGKGLWALPGGFLEGGENLLQCATREVGEETRLPLTFASLQAALTDSEVFDHPDRSPRAHIVTKAHVFDLKNLAPPSVEGSDDAEEAAWIPDDKLASMEETFFEDHFHILDHFLTLTE